jgi:drug/metabolite transporter (DMT)-like permease
MKARLALLVTILAWGSSFAAMRIAVTGFSATHVALLRFLVASAALAAFAGRTAARRIAAMPRGDLARIAVVGVLGLGVYNIALAAGQAHLHAGTSSILIATAPIWMAVVAVTVGRERLRGRAKLGLALGFAGVVLVKGGTGVGGAASAIAIVLGAAVLQAVYTMSQKPLVARHGALAFLCAAVWAATLALLPALPGLAHEIAAASARQLAAVAFLGLVPSAIGYATWAYASTRVSTSVAGAALYVIPPCALVIAYLVLGEAPAPGAVAGGALVLLSVALLR